MTQHTLPTLNAATLTPIALCRPHSNFLPAWTSFSSFYMTGWLQTTQRSFTW